MCVCVCVRVCVCVCVCVIVASKLHSRCPGMLGAAGEDWTSGNPGMCLHYPLPASVKEGRKARKCTKEEQTTVRKVKGTKEGQTAVVVVVILVSI